MSRTSVAVGVVAGLVAAVAFLAVLGLAGQPLHLVFFVVAAVVGAVAGRLAARRAQARTDVRDAHRQSEAPA
jgi:membrane protein implicated in regulation of membrane protease activity